MRDMNNEDIDKFSDDEVNTHMQSIPSTTTHVAVPDPGAKDATSSSNDHTQAPTSENK